MAILDPHRMPNERAPHGARRARLQQDLKKRGLAAVLLAPGSDLTYFSGHRIHGSERITCLVLPAGGAPALVVPELESPRAKQLAPDLAQRTWGETDDPYALIASLVKDAGEVAVSDQMWA